MCNQSLDKAYVRLLSEGQLKLPGVNDLHLVCMQMLSEQLGAESVVSITSEQSRDMCHWSYCLAPGHTNVSCCTPSITLLIAAQSTLSSSKPIKSALTSEIKSNLGVCNQGVL